jgi:hypothetical protein
MRAEELRIGNLIKGHYDDKSDIVKVIGYDPWENFIWVEGSLNAEFYEEFSPIPLIEEWLVKFGFHYAPDCLIYGKSGWFKKIEKQDNPTYFFFNNHLQASLFLSSDKIKVSHLSIDFECEYVHQFQNIYFSLTGQKLTIK